MQGVLQPWCHLWPLPESPRTRPTLSPQALLPATSGVDTAGCTHPVHSRVTSPLMCEHPWGCRGLAWTPYCSTGQRHQVSNWS